MARDPATQTQQSETMEAYWKLHYETMKVIADKRLEEMGRQDDEIARLRREVAALRARAK